MKNNKINCDILVVGSGPGGAVTAHALAQAGRDVLLVEEGAHEPVDMARLYTLEETLKKYRNGGITASLGKEKVVYVEGKCVGGASEINAGLYHYPLPEILGEWQREYQVEHITAEDLEPYFRDNEKNVPVSKNSQGLGKISQKIKMGADQLQWKNDEVPRCWKFENGGIGEKQSMSATLVPKALENGCRLLPETKVIRLIHSEGKAKSAIACQNKGKEKLEILFNYVFICSGAVQTPLILRRSGIKKNVGNSLKMHPAVRMVARFDDNINDPAEGVPVQQVAEFKPTTTLGGSFSGPPHLALWLSQQKDMGQRMSGWKTYGMFYALVKGNGKGRVRNIPFLNEASVSLDVTEQDRRSLGEGLYRLGQMLFSAGAREILSPIKGKGVYKNLQEMEELKNGLPSKGADISTIHLFCSCPMGEDKSRCAVNSYGRLHGSENIYLNDASILPDSPAVNPQATIMAVARRNVVRFLQKGDA